MVYIYVLKLEQDKYYIGKTSNPFFRLNDHFLYNTGSEWTKKYKPKELIELVSNCDDYDEDKYTRMYMDIYGIENVRGGSFVSIELDYHTIEVLKMMSNGTNNRCFKCGKEGHFSKNCKSIQSIENKTNHKNNSINFDTLLYRKPLQIIVLLNDIESLDKLQYFKIKIGNYVLNKNKNYNKLYDIIDNIKNIYNYTDNEIARECNIDINTAIIVKRMLLNSKNLILRNLCDILSGLSASFIEALQNGKTIHEIKNTHILALNEIPK